MSQQNNLYPKDDDPGKVWKSARSPASVCKNSYPLDIVPISISLNEVELIQTNVHGLVKHVLSISQHHSLYKFPLSVLEYGYLPLPLILFSCIWRSIQYDTYSHKLYGKSFDNFAYIKIQN